MVCRALTFACALAASFACGAPALADRVQHPTAVFAGLDKITGRIIAFEVAIDETVQFGSLQITPRVCYTRPLTEAPLTTGFVEVEEAVATETKETAEATEDKKFKRVFGGWMFAASPGLHGIEHAVYDAWLTDCRGGEKAVADSAAPDGESANAAPAAARQRRQPAAPSPAAQAAPRRTPPPASAQQQPRRQPSQSFFPSPF